MVCLVISTCGSVWCVVSSMDVELSRLKYHLIAKLVDSTPDFKECQVVMLVLKK